jgi:Zn-dependent protease
MSNLNLMQSITIWTLPVLLSIVVHEVSHGYVASLLGDKTAQLSGRLTLNPFKHIDPIGTIAVPLLCLLCGSFIFGWAKPVPINLQNLKNYKTDTALVAIAGLVANFLMAIMWALFVKSIIMFFPSHILPMARLFFIHMGYAGISINILLLVLNLIPIPPLDGSKVVFSLLPSNVARVYDYLEQYGFIILIILMYSNILSIIIIPALNLMQNSIFKFFAI